MTGPNDIAGWFLADEGAWYSEAVRQHPEGLVIEIGCWKGRSTSYLAPVLKGKQQRLVVVDHFSGSSDAWNDKYRSALEEANRHGLSVQSQFELNMTLLEIPYKLLTTSSREASSTVLDSSAAVVFIDASHDGPSVAQDLRFWLPKVRCDGILAGHDYGIEHPDLMASVHRFSEEIGLPILRGPGTIYYFEMSRNKNVFTY